MKDNKTILNIKGLKTYFPLKKGVLRKTYGYLKAVDDVDLNINEGEVFGLVGESGCGKTTLGRSILQLVNITEGELVYKFRNGEKDLRNLNKSDIKDYRKEIQMIFQDPQSSFNPALSIFNSLQDHLKTYGVREKKEREEIIGDLLESVNLSRKSMYKYPHQFSGGERQRIGIARALCSDPRLIICDEAVSALDVSIQAQVLKLLQKLKNEKNLTYIFISHDLSVVEYISDRIAVMYLGKVVECADSDELFCNPLHPYTKALLSSIPIADIDRKNDKIVLQGDVPNPISPPTGCPFHPRCRECIDECRVKKPELRKIEINGKEHFIACNLV